MEAVEFQTIVVSRGRDRVMVPISFDPDQLWGIKLRHHVAGTVNCRRVRAVIEALDDGLGFVLGSAWRRDCGIEPGQQVTVRLVPEGPQRDDLSADLAEALEANPAAALFFDSLAQFYRKGYLSWINATRRNPERRAERIGIVMQALADGKKTRPAS